jgi:hypothetical protein
MRRMDPEWWLVLVALAAIGGMALGWFSRGSL